MFDCGSGNWCCSRNCCSDANNFIQLGEVTWEATPGQANSSHTTSRGTKLQTAKSGATLVTSSLETGVPATLNRQTIASTRTANTTPATAAPSHTDTSSNVALKIGGGVGIPLAVALLGALVYIICLQHKHSRDKVSEPASGTIAEEENKDLPPRQWHPSYTYSGTTYYQPNFSADPEREHFELPPSPDPHQAPDIAVELSARP
ncbi:MAG: hypothetical protein Q9191_001766 [Dirinaria sp. TL-2023a]